jgi:protein phosphatase 1 regulatory subunit 7
VEKKTLELANPEALSDPEYSDEENVAPGEVIEADEGLS